MLIWLTRQFRTKAALAVAVLYTLCVVAPTMVMALSDSAAAHCLTEGFVEPSANPQSASHHHNTASSEHHHSGGGATHDPSNHDQKSHATNCCNLFTLGAIPNTATVMLATPAALRADFPALVDALRGRVPDRIIRPPIA